MSKFFERYLLREIAVNALGVTLVLLAILVANQFARILGDAAAGELPRSAVMPLLGLSSLTYLTVLVPIAMLLAVMLGLGRLYHDSEMAAAESCGLGPGTTAKPVMLFAVAVAIGLAFLTLFVAPWANGAVDQLKQQARSDVHVGSLVAGRFQSVGSGGAVIYAESIDDDGELNNVFMQYRSPVQLTVVTAKKGIEKRSEDGLSRSLVLHDGVRYSGKVGQQAYQQVSFAEHGIPLALPPVAAKKGDVESWSLAELFADRSIASRAELQWRLASPLMVLVLALAAVTLSRARPRQGRYSRLLWGLLVYIIYANLLTVARTAVEAERLPASIGLWGVHVVVFGLAIYWLFKRIGKNPRLIVNANTTPGAAA